MSQSVNVKFAKCFIIFMAIVILLQGIVYLGLAIWGIIIHNCGTDNSNPVNRPFEFVLDLIYFSSKECGPPSIYVEEIEQTVQLQIDYNIADVITNREFIFLIIYIAISALWVITSLFVLLTVCCTLSKLIAAVCFWPWLVSVIAGSILDAVATGYHVHDIIHTTSANSTLEYVGVQNDDMIMEYLQEYDVYFIAPAVAFTCISSRVVLIWLLNIFGSSFCLSMARSISSHNSKNKIEQQHRLPVDTTVPSQPQMRMPQNDERQMQEIQQQDTVVLRYHPTAPAPESLRKDRRTLEPLKSPQQQQSQLGEFIIAPYPPPVARQQSSTNNKRVNELKTQASITTDTPTYQSSDAHPENLDYPNNGYSENASQLTPRSATPELSAISPLNMRYSTTEGLPFPNQPHISQELRGVLPWSYTNINNDSVALKRIQDHYQPDNESLPPIPAPDYTLHPPKKDRAPVGQDRLSQTGYSRW